jgi:predicted ATPase
VGSRGERAVDAILAATMKNEKRNLGPKKRNKSFQEIIAYWLKDLGLIYSFKIEEIAENSNLYRTLVKKEAGASEVALTDVGFGVSQILPVLVLLYSVPEKSIVLLEQPEIHLHPAVQSQLADLMISVAKTRQIQIIVESHSEHLLRRFQRRVAEDNPRSSKAIVKSAHCSKRAMHFNLQSIEACSHFSFATIETLVSMTKTPLFII